MEATVPHLWEVLVEMKQVVTEVEEVHCLLVVAEEVKELQQFSVVVGEALKVYPLLAAEAAQALDLVAVEVERLTELVCQ